MTVYQAVFDGGSIRFTDPQRKLAAGYVMNCMINGLDPRNPNLCRAFYACLNTGLKD